MVVKPSCEAVSPHPLDPEATRHHSFVHLGELTESVDPEAAKQLTDRRHTQHTHREGCQPSGRLPRWDDHRLTSCQPGGERRVGDPDTTCRGVLATDLVGCTGGGLRQQRRKGLFAAEVTGGSPGRQGAHSRTRHFDLRRETGNSADDGLKCADVACGILTHEYQAWASCFCLTPALTEADPFGSRRRRAGDNPVGLQHGRRLCHEPSCHERPIGTPCDDRAVDSALTHAVRPIWVRLTAVRLGRAAAPLPLTSISTERPASRPWPSPRPDQAEEVTRQRRSPGSLQRPCRSSTMSNEPRSFARADSFLASEDLTGPGGAKSTASTPSNNVASTCCQRPAPPGKGTRRSRSRATLRSAAARIPRFANPTAAHQYPPIETPARSSSASVVEPGASADPGDDGVTIVVVPRCSPPMGNEEASRSVAGSTRSRARSIELIWPASSEPRARDWMTCTAATHEVYEQMFAYNHWGPVTPGRALGERLRRAPQAR